MSGTYYLGSPISYYWDGTGKDPYCNTVDQNIYKADAMIYYRIPVIKDIVKLRAGAGFGLHYNAPPLLKAHDLSLIDAGPPIIHHI